MFVNSRRKSSEQLSLGALSQRTVLTEQELLHLRRMENGYNGECLYDKIFTEVGHDDVLVYRDLYLKIGESVTQYDALVVNDGGVCVNEIKNYTGDYRVEKESWYRGKYHIADDPLVQLKRSLGKLIRLRDSARGRFKVSGKVVFVSDDFYLASDDSNIWDKVIVRTGLKRYLRQFKGRNIGESAKFISRLVENSEVENPYFNPRIDRERLRLGLYCGECGSFDLEKGRFHFDCTACWSRESNETHLLRAMSDYKFLFHGQDMTRNDLLDFIGGEIHYKTVHRFMAKHCFIEDKGNNTVYKFKYYDFEEAIRLNSVNIRYKNHLTAVDGQ